MFPSLTRRADRIAATRPTREHTFNTSESRLTPDGDSCTAVHPHPPPSTPHCAFSVTSVSACSRKRIIHWISDKERRTEASAKFSIRGARV
eukprot:scaffold110662_cov63-Phaeocystis_antarctica.AAC.1